MPEIMELEKQVPEVSTQAQAITIKNQIGYDKANDFLKAIKGLQVKVRETFRPIIEKAHLAHKEAVNKEKEHLEPLLKAEELVKTKMVDFYQEQERIRQAEQRKLEAEAERKRQEALKKAEEARENGQEVKADKYENKAAEIVAPTLAPTIDKGSTVITKRYHAEVVDLMALVKAVASGKAPLSLIEANMPVLNAQARALKETMSYPGVKVIAEQDLSTRTK